MTKTKNGTRQPNCFGEDAADERPDETADRVRDAVEAVDVVRDFDRVVVGEQRVVRRGDDRAAHPGAGTHDDEHQDRRREAGREPEHRTTPRRR